jgi:hypothetical protein
MAVPILGQLDHPKSHSAKPTVCLTDDDVQVNVPEAFRFSKNQECAIEFTDAMFAEMVSEDIKENFKIIRKVSRTCSRIRYA